MVSLVARIAPEADIYVGRVAMNAEDLLGAGDKVAEVSLPAPWQSSILYH